MVIQRTKPLISSFISSVFFIAIMCLPIANRTCIASADYAERIGYEIFVRAFADSDGDGIGDFKGIIEKLDHFKGDDQNDHSLHVNLLWLMPIFESPSYHGYDVTNYKKTNKDYGSMEDFSDLLNACHARDIKVIIDLPLNHCSNAHPWFKKATIGKVSRYKKWFVWRKLISSNWHQPWNPTGDSSSVWHQAGDDYYYAVFTGSMPDLNLNNNAVTHEIFCIADFWLDKGVDGFRIDAARYLIETGPGKGQADTLMTQHWLKKFYQHIHAHYPNAILILEIWENMETISPYLYIENTDYKTFNFQIADAILTAVKNRNWNILRAVYELRKDFYPSNHCDTLFLSNHDQNRVASVLPELWKQKLAASLLFTLPGTPFIYYGEEIGMKGVKPDPNIRKQFCWDSHIAPHCKDHALSNLQTKANSLFTHYCRLTEIRMNEPLLHRGHLNWIKMESESLCSYLITSNADSSDTCIGLLIIANFQNERIIPRIATKNLPLDDGSAVNLYNGKKLDIRIPANTNVYSFSEIEAGELQIWKLQSTHSNEGERP